MSRRKVGRCQRCHRVCRYYSSLHCERCHRVLHPVLLDEIERNGLMISMLRSPVLEKQERERRIAWYRDHLLPNGGIDWQNLPPPPEERDEHTLEEALSTSLPGTEQARTPADLTLRSTCGVTDIDTDQWGNPGL